MSNNIALLHLLSGGDRRSIGNAAEMVNQVHQHPEQLAILVEGLTHADMIVRMRSADVIEKVTRNFPEQLSPFKMCLLMRLTQEKEHEVLWHLAQMVPRLSLTESEKNIVITQLLQFMQHRSSILKTMSMQALFDIAQNTPSQQAKIRRHLETFTQTGTKAMKKRGENLLKQFK